MTSQSTFLSREDVDAIVNNIPAYKSRWPLYQPLFLQCEGHPDIWCIQWVNSSGKPAGTLLDKLTFCLIRKGSKANEVSVQQKIHNRVNLPEKWTGLKLIDTGHVMLVRMPA